MPTSKCKKDWKQCNQYILFDKRADARLGLDANCLKPNLYFGFRRLLQVWQAVFDCCLAQCPWLLSCKLALDNLAQQRQLMTSFVENSAHVVELVEKRGGNGLEGVGFS